MPNGFVTTIILTVTACLAFKCVIYGFRTMFEGLDDKSYGLLTAGLVIALSSMAYFAWSVYHLIKLASV